MEKRERRYNTKRGEKLGDHIYRGFTVKTNDEIPVNYYGHYHVPNMEGENEFHYLREAKEGIDQYIEKQKTQKLIIVDTEPFYGPVANKIQDIKTNAKKQKKHGKKENSEQKKPQNEKVNHRKGDTPKLPFDGQKKPLGAVSNG